MPKPPKPISEESKAGLQDDHDPRDPAQQGNLPNTQREGGQHVNEGKGEDFKTPKQPAGPYDRGKPGGGNVDEQGLPADDSKFG